VACTGNRLRRRVCRSGDLRLFPLRDTRAPADFHTAQEHDDDDGGRDDEQEDQLLPAQLNFVKAVVGRVV
jgi:2-polyprenyl-6-methoxyphenol hydroxylase-like FAD-dependent oxidoreductase